MRETLEILRLYHAAALAARTPEFYVRARQRKSYLTPEVIARHGLGLAPTLRECLAAGLTELELRAVGLLCDPVSDGPDRSPYLFFRDCIIIPYYRTDGTGPVYFSSRRLSDTRADGTLLDKGKKALCMRRPGEDGRGGVERPAFWCPREMRTA